MKRFRVITGLRGNYCLQARRPFPFPFLWRTHAVSADSAQLRSICARLISGL